MTQAGRFITFEGGEGSGKTTLILKLKEVLEQKGISCLATREPGGTPFGDEVRSLVLEKREQALGKRAETLLFLAARAEHVEKVIQPAISESKVVLCDRFSDSTLAYQGVARGLGLPEVSQLCHFATGGLEPHLTLYLDIDPEVGLLRAKKASKAEVADRMEEEKLSFHKAVREGFLLLAQKYPNRIQVLDAARPFEEVLKHASELITHVLATPRK